MSDDVGLEDFDEADDGLDLSPRKRDDIKRGSRVVPSVIIGVTVLVIGFVLFQGLSGATLSLRQADTAVAERADLADKRFRLLGSPIAITEDDFALDGEATVRFSIACDGTAVDVIHQGDFAESFQLGVPVVLEGRWAPSATVTAGPWQQGANDGFYFESDRMLVKHDNEYRNDRVEQASSCGSSAVDAPEA